MTHKSFSEQEIDISFDVGGETFTLRKHIPAAVMISMGSLQRRIKESLADPQGSPADVLLGIFFDILDEPSFGRFSERFFGTDKTAPVVGLGMFNEIVEYVLEEIVKKDLPGKSSSSSPGPPATMSGPHSTDGVPPVVSTPRSYPWTGHAT